MPSFLARMALVSFCLSPLPGVVTSGSHGALVASFIHSCDASNPRPRVRTTLTAPERLKRRPESAPVEVFQQGEAPDRKFAAIGTVDVLASGSRTSVADLTDWAKRGARQLGGDALVDVSWDDAASVRPPAGPVGLLYLTATVVRWESPGP